MVSQIQQKLMHVSKVNTSGLVSNTKPSRKVSWFQILISELSNHLVSANPTSNPTFRFLIDHALRLEIGENDLMSSGSLVDFFILGQTQASLWLSGKCPSTNIDHSSYNWPKNVTAFLYQPCRNQVHVALFWRWFLDSLYHFLEGNTV